MPDDPFQLRGKSDLELYEWTSKYHQATPHYIAGQQEIRRRNASPTSKRTWIAIGISAFALVVAIVALFD